MTFNQNDIGQIVREHYPCEYRVVKIFRRRVSQERKCSPIERAEHPQRALLRLPIRVYDFVYLRIRVVHRLFGHLDGVVRDDTVDGRRTGAIHVRSSVPRQISAIAGNLRGTLDGFERGRKEMRVQLRAGDETSDLLLPVRVCFHNFFLCRC